MRLSSAVFLFILGVIIAQTAYYYPILPEMVASHFNAAGTADNWMSKQTFVIFEAVIFLVVIGQFVLLPYLIEKLPDSLINLPNKQYWLAAERRAETFAKIRNFFKWFGVGLLLLLILVNQQVYRANISGENLSAVNIWLIIGGFLVFSVCWMIMFIRQFKIKK